MKKTLVALAALAATGAFAQVTITGEFAYGYQTTSGVTNGATGTPANTVVYGDAAGFGVDTSQLWFKASEDLGGGYKAGVSMSLGGADRSGESTATSGNGGVTGRDAQLDLTTPFGLLSMGTKKNADYLSGIAGVGAVWYTLDGQVQGARTRRDQWTFAVPVSSALTLAVSQQEAAENMGLGGGSAGAASTTGQRLTAIVANYKSGAFVVDGQYLMFDGRTDNSNTSLKDQMRLSGNYDLGVAKLGAGLTSTTYMGTKKVTDTLIGVSVPMGAVTLGANWAQDKIEDSGTAAADGTKTGYVVQAQYNLSKSTYFIASYKRYDPTLGYATVNAAGTAVGATALTQTNLLLVKDF